MFAVSRDVEAMLIDKAWREEIRRRLDEINSGGVELIPWEEARRRLRSRLERPVQRPCD